MLHPVTCLTTSVRLTQQDGALRSLIHTHVVAQNHKSLSLSLSVSLSLPPGNISVSIKHQAACKTIMNIQNRIYTDKASKALGFSKHFFFCYKHIDLVRMCRIPHLKIKIPQKYPLTLKQVVVTELSVQFGCVRCSQKHQNSRQITNLMH
jgi:hypothetical protein